MIVNKFETEDGVTLFRLNGKLIDSTLDSPKSGIDTALDDGHLWLVVNCSELLVVDQAGIGFLLSRVRQSRKRSGDMALAGLQPAALQLLSESDNGETIRNFGHEEEAIDYLRACRKKGRK